MGLLTWIQLWASVFRRGERTCVGSLQSPMPSFMSELDIQIPSAFGMFFDPLLSYVHKCTCVLHKFSSLCCFLLSAVFWKITTTKPLVSKFWDYLLILDKVVKVSKNRKSQNNNDLKTGLLCDLDWNIKYPGCKHFLQKTRHNFSHYMTMGTAHADFCCLLLCASCVIWWADPFAEANDKDSAGAKGYVHVRIQQRNGRKRLTTVQGLKKEFSYSKILKDLKKEFCCNGTVVQDPELGQVLILHYVLL